MTPASIILDLLRTYPHRGTTVKAIMATGAMFDFSDNVMRVNLSRLVSKGIVENFERGYYRLTNHTDPINDFVESWRQGEARVRPWNKVAWAVVHASDEPAAKRSWALDAYGFREIATNLWLRPDNLAVDRQTLETRLKAIGLDDRSILVDNAGIDKRWQDAWRTQFDLEQLTASYRTCETRLRESAARLLNLPREAAMREAFHLGGEAVHILAKDPLLPAEFIDTRARMKLWKTMLAYDQAGRAIWGMRPEGQPETIPTPQLIVETNSRGKAPL